MPKPVTLLMALHSHQPVGNFGFVFEEAFVKAYEPFLRVLEQHPRVSVSLHYSGPLLDWLAENRPDFLKRVSQLILRGQAEILASGYYEPILPLIPEKDRQGQIRMMRQAVEKHFQAQSSGLWLTERVWEPELPGTLSRAGIRYTMVDTNQFVSAKPWIPAAAQVSDEKFWDLLGFFTTDYAGCPVSLFPASKRLRYWLPFQPVEKTIDFLRTLKREQPVAITFADDGEKFGLWPKTHRWVYEERWLDNFFSALEREESWLGTSTFSRHLEGSQPAAHVYLPCGSYEEMLEWSGGYFRNFFTKYPEANAMQQQMLRISEALQDFKPAPRNLKLIEQARQHLYAAQCNCAYWHGVFGGLYLAHLRNAVYAHLIAAQQILNKAKRPSVAVDEVDIDGDGVGEVRLTTPAMSVVVDCQKGGTLSCWYAYESRVNFCNTLTRRPESYHKALRAAQSGGVGSSDPVSSIHDEVKTKEENLVARLVYDDHTRGSFIDYAFSAMPSLAEIVESNGKLKQLRGAERLPWDRQTGKSASKKSPVVSMVRAFQAGLLRKTVQLSSSQPVLECRYELRGADVPVAGLEFNLALRDQRFLTSARQYDDVTRLELEEQHSGIRVAVSIEPAAQVVCFPIETVSESEGGMERTYQGLGLMFLWTVTRRDWAGNLQWAVKSPGTAAASPRNARRASSVSRKNTMAKGRLR